MKFIRWLFNVFKMSDDMFQGAAAISPAFVLGRLPTAGLDFHIAIESV